MENSNNKQPELIFQVKNNNCWGVFMLLKNNSNNNNKKVGRYRASL